MIWYGFIIIIIAVCFSINDSFIREDNRVVVTIPQSQEVVSPPPWINENDKNIKIVICPNSVYKLGIKCDSSEVLK